jgi:hypothetical protein
MVFKFPLTGWMFALSMCRSYRLVSKIRLGELDRLSRGLK